MEEHAKTSELKSDRIQSGLSVPWTIAKNELSFRFVSELDKHVEQTNLLGCNLVTEQHLSGKLFCRRGT